MILSTLFAYLHPRSECSPTSTPSIPSDGQALDDLGLRHLRPKQPVLTQLRHRHVQDVVTRAVLLHVDHLRPLPAREPDGRRPLHAPVQHIPALDDRLGHVVLVARVAVGVLLDVHGAVPPRPLVLPARRGRTPSRAAADARVGLVMVRGVDHVQVLVLVRVILDVVAAVGVESQQVLGLDHLLRESRVGVDEVVRVILAYVFAVAKFVRPPPKIFEQTGPSAQGLLQHVSNRRPLLQVRDRRRAAAAVAAGIVAAIPEQILDVHFLPARLAQRLLHPLEARVVQEIAPVLGRAYQLVELLPDDGVGEEHLHLTEVVEGKVIPEEGA
mmetsp:Transcript_14084/g.30591  ORF Transcript_14084/g.30591 Transcript_14084/m.30591 type:complete len:327 (+) Transcript_14084:178-1158(+)